MRTDAVPRGRLRRRGGVERMSAVTLFAALAGAPAASGAGRGRAPEESGSLFGAALAIAGQAVDGAVAETTAPPAGEHTADGAAPDAVGAEPASDDAAAALATAAPASVSFPPTEAIPTPVFQPEAAQDSGQDAPTSPDAGALAALPVQAPAAAAAGAASDPRAPLAVPAVPAVPGVVVGASGDGAAGNPTANTHAITVPSSAVGGHPLEVGADAPAGSASSRAVQAATGEGTPVGPGAAAPTVPASASPTPAADPVEATPVSPTSPAATVIPAPQTAAPAVTPGGAPESAAATPRAVAAQVSPVVVSIAQRPAGTHQLTMTVNPESLGPVTVRAHISPRGEVQVELLGATDAGRDALRTIAADLRRDLAAVMPSATLSLSTTGSDAGWQDRGTQPGPGDRSGGQPGDSRRQSGGDPAHPAAAQGASRAIPTTAHAASGAGLDIFV